MWLFYSTDVWWHTGAVKCAKMSALYPSSLAIGARFPYRTFVVRRTMGADNPTNISDTNIWRHMDM